MCESIYAVWLIHYTDSIAYFGYRQQAFQRNATLEKEKIRFMKLTLSLFVEAKYYEPLFMNAHYTMPYTALFESLNRVCPSVALAS